MKRNKKLEKYQKEEYNDTVGTFRAVVEVAGITSEESDTLEAKKPGVTLHFLRYGLFNNADDINEVAQEVIAPIYDFDENGKAVPNQGVNLAPVHIGGPAPDFQPPSGPKFNTSFYQRTCLNEGFLYIIEDHEEFRCLEYYVNELSGLHPILWSKNLDPEGNYSDDRSEIESLTGYTHTIKPGTTIWVAYSDVQWSIAQLETIQADANKKNRMQQFVCNPIEKTEENNFDENSELLPFTNLKASFKAHQNSQSYMFLDRLDRIALAEQKPDPENTQLEDLFVTLYDPIGLCADASLHLRSLWLDMDALLISVKTAVNATNVKHALLNNQKPESLQKSKEDLKQASALFNLATTLRSVAFSNEESKEDLIEAWGGLDVPRLENVLATEERKQLKNKIQKARKELIIAFKSEHFDIIKEDYICNTSDNLATGKLKILQLLFQLSLMPNFKDGFMETKEESRKWASFTDEGQIFIADLISSKNNIGKLLDKKTILEHVESQANYLKWIGITDTLFSFAKDLRDKGDEILDSIIKKSNSNRIRIKKVLYKSALKITSLGEEFADSDIGESDLSKKLLNINEHSQKEFKKLAKKRIAGFDKLSAAKQVTFTKAFAKVAQSEIVSDLTDIQESSKWTKLTRSFSFFNLAMAGAALRKSDNNFQKKLNYAKFFQASADAAVVSSEILVAKKVFSAKKTAKLASFSRFGKRFTGYAGVLMDATEAGYNFWERDYDAAIGYSSAALAGGLSIACFAFSATVGAANFWNPVGWVLLIAAGVIGFYVAYLEDNPLETMVKNGLFARSGATQDLLWGLIDADVDFKGNYLQQIKQHISLKNRKLIHDNAEWIDLSVQYQKLMDVLVAGRIALTIEYSIKDEEASSSEPGNLMDPSILTEVSKVTSVKTEVTFGGYLTHKEQLEIEIVTLENGLGTTPEIHDYLPKDIDIIKVNKDINKAVFMLSIGSALHVENAILMVLARIKISEGQYFPLQDDQNTPRYVAAILPTLYSIRLVGPVYTDDNKTNTLVVDTQQKLIAKKVWK